MWIATSRTSRKRRCRVTPADGEGLARGELRLRQRDRIQLLKLDETERAEFERGKRRGYVVTKGVREELATIWWHWCSATRRPYVIVKVRRTRAWVQLELTAPGIELSPEAIARAHTALWCHARNGGFGTSHRAASHFRVPLERAELLAKDLLEIAHDGTQPYSPTQPPSSRSD